MGINLFKELQVFQ